MLELLTYPFGDTVMAFSTERGLDHITCEKNGMERAAYSGFNITHYCGDDRTHVERCKAELAKVLHIPVTRILLPTQVHDTKVAIVDGLSKSDMLEGVDALVTNERKLCIGISTADCIPLLFFDPVHNAIGAAHAGWRGTVKHIANITIHTMEKHFNTLAADLRVVVGPGISREAFQVGEEVYDVFQSAGFPMNSIAKKQSKWHIDLFAANVHLLLEAGIDLAHIAVSNICTYTNSSRFFSARRLGIASGRIYNGILMK